MTALPNKHNSGQHKATEKDEDAWKNLRQII